MEGLLSICYHEGIDVDYVPLTRHGGILGWYRPAEGSDPPMILLDEKLPDSPPLERTVLAEEVGHHRTVPIGTLGSEHVISNSRLNGSNRYRDEGRAVRWAAKYLMPTMALAEAAREGCHTVTELAEWFNVTEWIVHRRKRILREDLRRNQGLRVSVRELFAPILVENLWGNDLSRPTRRLEVF